MEFGLDEEIEEEEEEAEGKKNGATVDAAAREAFQPAEEAGGRVLETSFFA